MIYFFSISFYAYLWLYSQGLQASAVQSCSLLYSLLCLFLEFDYLYLIIDMDSFIANVMLFAFLFVPSCCIAFSYSLFFLQLSIFYHFISSLLLVYQLIVIFIFSSGCFLWFYDIHLELIAVYLQSSTTSSYMLYKALKQHISISLILAFMLLFS